MTIMIFYMTTGRDRISHDRLRTGPPRPLAVPYSPTRRLITLRVIDKFYNFCKFTTSAFESRKNRKSRLFSPSHLFNRERATWKFKSVSFTTYEV